MQARKDTMLSQTNHVASRGFSLFVRNAVMLSAIVTVLALVVLNFTLPAAPHSDTVIYSTAGVDRSQPVGRDSR
ncbi:hypothetical protein [Parvularcula sp. IMCC14364]|uniref:hypothetical protein n=1 Tax=Parvularcula sp. IMCC14364 TaxID=3067902 RepID=UPI00274111D7|nr:hypothetical protein [Parvularcula sp. IMCC14364]